MTDRLKTILAWDTLILLLFALWTAKFQMKTIAFTLVIGAIGTLMIFATEFLYGYRKAGALKLGSLRVWLRAHIVTGIAGPTIILWHTGLNFHGFAGWLAYLTAVVVASGLTGRYIYKHIPRTLKGKTRSLADLEGETKEIESRLEGLLAGSPDAERLVALMRAQFGRLGRPDASDSDRSGWRLWLILTGDWHLGRLRTKRLLSKDYPVEHDLLVDLEKLEFRRLTLTRLIRLLDGSKAMLAKWRLMHIPLTLALFVGIMIHVGSVLYYGKVWP